MTPAGVPGWFNSMPSYIAPLQVAGIKLVGGYAENPKHGKPYIKANLMLTDPESGDLRAVMCGGWISRKSGAATSRPQPGSGSSRVFPTRRSGWYLARQTKSAAGAPT